MRQIKYVVIVACREAGSGEASWHAELGVLLDDEWVEGWDPTPPPNRAGDYPRESRYAVVPYGGRFRGYGISDVHAAHVPLIKELLRNPIVNPHMCGLTSLLERNWIDADLPLDAVVAGHRAVARLIRSRAEIDFARAEAALASAQREVARLEEYADALDPRTL
jgi:hypothetical protein